MVQVLPYVPSPLEQLTPYIAQAGQAAGSAIGKIVEHRKVSNIMDKMQDPKVTDAEKNKMTMDLMRIYSPQYLPMMLAGQQMMNQINRANQSATPPAAEATPSGEITPTTAMPAEKATELSPTRKKLADEKANIEQQIKRWHAASFNPLTADQSNKNIASLERRLDRINSREMAYEKQDIKSGATEETSEQKLGGLQYNINNLRGLLEYTGNQWGIKTIGGPLRRETIQQRARFDTAGAQLFSLIKELESKGVISKPIFQNMEKKIPNSELSERENAGRLDGFQDMINSLSPSKRAEANKIWESVQKTPSASAKKTTKERPPLESFIR